MNEGIFETSVDDLHSQSYCFLCFRRTFRYCIDVPNHLHIVNPIFRRAHPNNMKNIILNAVCLPQSQNSEPASLSRCIICSFLIIIICNMQRYKRLTCRLKQHVVVNYPNPAIIYQKSKHSVFCYPQTTDKTINGPYIELQSIHTIYSESYTI